MKDPRELLRNAMNQRYEMATEIWMAMKTIDYETLAICAVGIRSMSNAPSTDQREKDEEAHAAADWAARVWFESLTLALFLKGKVKISGRDCSDMRFHIVPDSLPIDAPHEFVKLLTYADEM